MPRSKASKFSLALLAVSILCLPSISAQEQKDDAVRLGADIVLVNATVTDAAGKYAHGLKREDFSIVEDNVPQEIAYFGAEETPFAAAILLDTSGSMETKLSVARAAAAQFVDRIRTDDVVAVYGFSTEVKQLQEFSPVRDITDLIWETQAEGWTKMFDCIIEAVSELSKREEKRRAILLLSDGEDTRSGASMSEALRKALAAGVTVYSIDLIDTAARSAMSGSAILRDFAEKTGGRYIKSQGGTSLSSTFVDIVEELRNQYTLAYYFSGKPDGKWRSIEVKLSRPELTARARKGYYAPKK